MKIIESTNGLSKTCHANFGDVIRLPETRELFVVAFFAGKNCRTAKEGASSGLYNEERPMFMVNLVTGEAKPLPHLSSRVEILRRAALVEDAIDQE